MNKRMPGSMLTLVCLCGEASPGGRCSRSPSRRGHSPQGKAADSPWPPEASPLGHTGSPPPGLLDHLWCSACTWEIDENTIEHTVAFRSNIMFMARTQSLGIQMGTVIIVCNIQGLMILAAFPRFVKKLLTLRAS